MKDVYEHLAKSVDGDHIVYLHVTSPLEKLSKNIEIYKNLQ